MQGKGDDKFEGFLNVKDLRRQTTANEEKLVISASANGNNQSGNSSTLECSSLISKVKQKLLLTFLVTTKKPSIFNHISLLIPLNIFRNSSLNLCLRARYQKSKTTEVVIEQSHKIKMKITTINFNHKLSLQERNTEPVYLLIQSKLFVVSYKERGQVV